MPVTGTEGTVPPANPAQDIDPSPNFLADCSARTYDDSAGCVNATLVAISNARSIEGLPAMVLPTNWSSLSATQQLFVATNLERTARGLPALSGMATLLDGASALAAAEAVDPSPPAGFPWSAWGGNWAAAVGNPLEAIYYWMYDDGEGSTNIDCTSTNTSGCWGHRDNILMSISCTPCVMGTGYNSVGWEGYPSWAELLVQSSGSPALDYSWSDVLANLPGATTETAPAGPVDPIVGMVSTSNGGGYWLVASGGGVYTFGNAAYYGSMGNVALPAPVVAMAMTPDEGGYWLVTSAGDVYSFGDAAYHGSTGAMALNKPIVGMAVDPDTGGYWLVASDGGIFSFNAPFEGSTGAMSLNRPIVGMSVDPATGGYWLVASDGGIFSFNAPFEGSTGAMSLVKPVVGMAVDPAGGYWLTASEGGVFSFCCPFEGSLG